MELEPKKTEELIKRQEEDIQKVNNSIKESNQFSPKDRLAREIFSYLEKLAGVDKKSLQDIVDFLTTEENFMIRLFLAYSKVSDNKKDFNKIPFVRLSEKFISKREEKRELFLKKCKEDESKLPEKLSEKKKKDRIYKEIPENLKKFKDKFKKPYIYEIFIKSCDEGLELTTEGKKISKMVQELANLCCKFKNKFPEFKNVLKRCEDGVIKELSGKLILFSNSES